MRAIDNQVWKKEKNARTSSSNVERSAKMRKKHRSFVHVREQRARTVFQEAGFSSRGETVVCFFSYPIVVSYLSREKQKN